MQGQDPNALIQHFYPRSPRGERPHRIRLVLCPHTHFYPRSPRGERPALACIVLRGTDFYPRSPRGERLAPLYDEEDGALFLSTLPARGAT